MSETPRTSSLLFDEVVLLCNQVHQLERDLFAARAENEWLREALSLLYEHARLYCPDLAENNVGIVVRAALAAKETTNG